MESITVYPKSERQKSLLKSLLEEMKVRFEVVQFSDESLLSEKEFFSKIDKSLAQVKAKKTRILTKAEQKAFLGL
jgi:hypothetical protein